MKPFTDITGIRFGRLLVLSRIPPKNNKPGIWMCRCDCGSELKILYSKLKDGSYTSCGCWRRSGEFNLGKGKFSGYTQTITGSTWRGMKKRCFSPRAPGYHLYGGAGIVPCKFILEDPRNLVQIIGERPSLGMTLDRIDNDLGYNCGQCGECISNGWTLNIRWATWKEQGANRRNVIRVLWNGKEQTLMEIAPQLGITANTLWQRWYRKPKSTYVQ